MENIALSQHFVLTNNKEELGFTALKWLSRQEKEVIDQIIELSDSFFAYHDDDDADPSFECVDYLTFCQLIVEKEIGNRSPSEKEKENSLMGMALFSVYENMRRKNFVNFIGTGLVSEFDKNTTEIELTEIGKIYGGSIKTLSDIAQQMEDS